MGKIQFDTTNYTKYSNNFEARVSAWNQAEAKRHLSTTTRWADKLVKKNLPLFYQFTAAMYQRDKT